MFSLYKHCKTKQNKKFRGFHKKFRGFSKINENKIFEILVIHIPSLGSGDPTQTLFPIGLAVLTFIGNKQTNRETDKLSI